MIYVGGVPFSADNSSSSKGNDMLIALMEHPLLVSASNSFEAIPERKFSFPEDSNFGSSRRHKCVYVFQREYAVVDPALVELIGTDEATTCVGIVIRNGRSGMTSIAHMDTPKVVEIGLSQMLSLVEDPNDDAVLDVHLVGSFMDAAPQYADYNNKSESFSDLDGYSAPLCTKIVEALERSRLKFNIQTFHVLEHNTRWDSDGNAYPIFNGFVVEPLSGSIIPASFDNSMRCPDELVRRVRVSASFEDPSWNGRLLETYETMTDRFVIAPCSWTLRQLRFALSIRFLSDSEILLSCSTSPTAEGPDFVDNQRRVCEYFIQHPDWRETFPSRKPRVFQRTADGHWTMRAER